MANALALEAYPFDHANLPQGWITVPLGEVVVEAQNGFASGRHNSEGYGVPHLRPMNVTPSGDIDLNDLRYVITDRSLRLKKGDLLINNTNSPLWVGKSAVVASSEDLAFSNHMTRIQLVHEVHPVFAWMQLHCLRASGYFQHHAKTHINQSSLSTQFLLHGVPILIAPLHEQHQIVDLAEGTIQRTRSLSEIAVSLERLVQRLSELFHAFVYRGDLTRKWRARHYHAPSGLELLRSLGEDSAAEAPVAPDSVEPPNPEGGQSADQESHSPADVGLAEVPLTWTWTTADKVVHPRAEIVYGIVQPGPDVAGGVPYVRGLDIQDGQILVDQLRRTTPEIAARYSRSELQPGDVLLGIIRETKVAVVPDSLAGGNLTQGTARLRPSRILSTEYLAGWLRSPLAQTWLHSRFRGIDMPGLNLRDIRKLPIPVAPMAEQAQIVDRLSAFTWTAGQMRNTFDSFADVLRRLELSVLADAAQGKSTVRVGTYVDLSQLRSAVEVQRAQIKAIRSEERAAATKAKSMRSPRADEAGLTFLADILRQSGKPMSAEELWRVSGLVIDDFYAQLKREVLERRLREEVTTTTRRLEAL